MSQPELPSLATQSRHVLASRVRKGGSLGLAGLLVLAQPVAPAVITVTATCNLVAAITAANTDAPAGACPAGSGADTILLPSDETLTAVHSHTNGANGLPSITTPITVQGYDTRIRRDGAAPDFRIFHVEAGGELTLENVEVTNGAATIADSRFTGGGIFNLGRLALHHSTISGNEAVGNGTARGGGIYNAGTLTISDSSIVGNTAHATSLGSTSGGGVYNALGGALSVSTSTFSFNNSWSSNYNAEGGGVASRSTAPGSLVIQDSLFRTNSASVLGGAGLTYRSAYGGGIRAKHLKLSNATFSGNQVAIAAFDSDSYEAGGAVSMDSGIVDHVTFWGNRLNNQAHGAGALEAEAGTTVTGSTFADSTPGHCVGGFVDGGGGNLADDATCAASIAGTLTGLATSLADNGGPTETHALSAGSSAIDLAGDCGLGTDQRGAGRITPCDSGAFEVIGCVMLELESLVIDSTHVLTVCNTAVLAPELLVEGPGGDLSVTAGYLVSVKNGLIVESGAELELGTDPSLLP